MEAPASEVEKAVNHNSNRNIELRDQQENSEASLLAAAIPVKEWSMRPPLQPRDANAPIPSSAAIYECAPATDIDEKSKGIN